jgi:acetoin utilization protein AcuB
MKVNESMTKFVVCLYPKDTLQVAHTLMNQLHCRHLPIINDGRLVGIVSDRDILLSASKTEEGFISVPETPVEDVMIKMSWSVTRIPP